MSATVGKWIECQTYQPTLSRPSGPANSMRTKARSCGCWPRIPSPPSNCCSGCGKVATPAATASAQGIRARRAPTASAHAFLKLHFAPGQCAQVDWGSGRFFAEVGGTRRRLSFFVMVLCYSRRMYVEFTLAPDAGTLSGLSPSTPSNTFIPVPDGGGWLTTVRPAVLSPYAGRPGAVASALPETLPATLVLRSRLAAPTAA